MRTQYGECVECGFPILVKDSNTVACPYCSTKNLPVGTTVRASSGISVSPTTIIIGAIVLIGVVVLAKGRH